jgi:hypothetical protein
MVGWTLTSEQYEQLSNHISPWVSKVCMNTALKSRRFWGVGCVSVGLPKLNESVPTRVLARLLIIVEIS